MGSGVTKPRQHRHSDSRVEEIRADLSGKRVTAAGQHNNSTFTLNFTLPDYAGGQQRWRARSKSNPDVPPLLGEVAMTTQQEEQNDPEQEKQAQQTQDVKTEPLFKEEQEQGEDDDEYADKIFEDDITEWKKGESIGSGSYGTVYLARDELTGSLMAVKEILIAEENEAEVAAATREVELLRSLRDEHIVKYLGSSIDRENQKLSIFTEWVPGGNLEQNRKRFGGNETVVRRFTHQILLGVAYLHSKHIVHHDIKPSNILVDQNGIVKVADFGCSRLVSSSTSVNNTSMRGTPNYMAPEVIKQTSRSRKSDIWSVGCSVLRLLTGLPFWGEQRFDSQISLLYYVAHLEELPPLPGDLSNEARSFITACLEIDPMTRPTAAELLQHPFVCGFGPRSPMSSAQHRIHSAPVVSHTNATVRPLSLKRIPSTAPSPAIRSNKMGIGPRAHLASTASALPAETIDLPQQCEEETADTEHSIPNVSTVFPLDKEIMSPSKSLIRHRSASKAKKKKNRHPTEHIGNSITSPNKADDEEEDEQYSTTFTSNSTTKSTALDCVSSSHARASWEERPIVTDMARIEREKQSMQIAEVQRRREEREQKFQEELLAFRRYL